MAQGRPLSRHGRVDTFKRMPVDESEISNMYQKQEYISSRPKSGYRKRSEDVDYDSYARVPDSGSHDITPRPKPPARPVSRRRIERYSNHSDSDDNFMPSSPDGPLVSPKSPSSTSRQYPKQNTRKNSSEFNQPYSPSDSRPPTSGSSRPPSASARRRSARLHHRDNNPSQSYQNESSENMPSMSGIRPPSSFSKYRPLPAIGTPTPTDYDEPKFIYNDAPADSTSRDQFNNSHSQNERHLDFGNQYHLGPTHGRISSAVSDISVISTKANSSRRATENTVPVELIERLDLSQLDKPTENSKRRKPTVNQSPSHKPKSAVSTHSKFDSCELYDGDDDDSDTNIDCVNTFTQGKKENIPNLPRPPAKDPVIIPSQNELAAANLEQEILLAVKLPTNGTRHQRYFQRNEPLMAIVEFAEEQAGQDFAGYILVSSAPKNVYEDLRQTIDEAGLEDRSMLHLEEND